MNVEVAAPGETGQPGASGSPRRSVCPVAWLLLVGGVAGFLAAFTLMVEKLNLLTDPTYVPSCTMDAVINCTDVMTSDQAGLFGFPNPLIGIAAFPVLIVLGALLLSGVRLPDWVWLGLQIGVVFGVVFVGWLISQAVYEIGALCPYCMVVWAVVIPLFWVVTAENLNNGALADGDTGFGRGIDRAKWWLALASIAVVTALVLFHFRDVWF